MDRVARVGQFDAHSFDIRFVTLSAVLAGFLFLVLMILFGNIFISYDDREELVAIAEPSTQRTSPFM